MNENEVLAIVNNYYPKSIGIIETIYKQPDITLDKENIHFIIIDAQVSVVSSFFVSLNDIMIRLTALPLSDIENVIINESFEQRGGLLEKIRIGKIIKDSKSRILLKIQERSSTILHTINPINVNEFHHDIDDLAKQQINIEIGLDYYKKFDTIINKFADLISKIENRKLHNWNNKSENYLKNEKAGDLLFIDNMSITFRSALASHRDGEKKFLKMTDFIKHYLSIPHSIEPSTNLEELIIFDFTYPGISIDFFILTILPDLKNHPFLRSYYLYFYLSPQQYTYIYKNSISIVFKFEKYFDQSFFYNCMSELLNVYHTKISISQSPSYAFSNNPYRNFVLNFQPVAIEISKMVEQLVISKKNFNSERNILLGILLSSFTLENLHISQEDITGIHFYFSNRNLYTYQEQSIIKHPNEYIVLRDAKYQFFQNYYHENKSYINEAITKGKHFEHIKSDKIYYKALLELKEYVTKNLNRNTDEDSITINILQYHYNIKEPQKALLYILILEQLVQLLLLKPDQITLCLLVITESLQTHDALTKVK